MDRVHSELLNFSHHDASWYLTYTKPRSELAASDHLRRQNYQVWFPNIKIINNKRRDSASQFVFEPLFPRYLFVRPSSTEQSIAPIKSTTGVAKLVGFGHEPAKLSHTKLMEIARWVDHHNGRDATEIAGIHPGTAVQVTQGPFAQLQGLVQKTGPERVLVLLDILGKQHALPFPYSALAAL